MMRSTWSRDRRLLRAAFLLIFGFVIYRWCTPGLPVMRGPRIEPTAYIEGKALFMHNWRAGDPLAHGDGLGPVFNDTSCAACHNQGGIGGGGAGMHNVNTFTLFPPRDQSHVLIGLVHAHAVSPTDQETDAQVLLGQCDNLVRTSMNSTALFGGGWIDRISERAIRFEENKQMIISTAKETAGSLDATAGGHARVLPDGRIGRFGWKAQFATLDEFIAAACANEIGLGTSHMPQAAPMCRKAAVSEADLDDGQFDALAGYVRALPRPGQVMPTDAAAVAEVEHGRALFDSVGCAVCHVPDLGGVHGVYSDLLLHVIKTPGPETNGRSSGGDGVGIGYGLSFRPTSSAEPIDAPTESEWRTPPLWGVADSAPYFHDGGSPTLVAAILRHGGDGIHVTRRFRSLSDANQAALVAFLKTLRAPAEPDPASATPAAELVSVKK